MIFNNASAPRETSLDLPSAENGPSTSLGQEHEAFGSRPG
jgi:hypothetical protein